MPKRKPEHLVQFQYPSKRSTSFAPAPAIEALPEDLFVEVLARVASYSLNDLFNTKLTSKYFLGAANDHYIFRHVSLQNFPRNSWNMSPQESSFLKTCFDSGNPEALYRQGMREFFSYRKQASGLTNLKASAEKGHREASYVYGIILFLSSTSLHSLQEGLGFLKSCESKSMTMKECRRKIRGLVRDIWINNRIFPENANFPGCQTSSDCALKHRRSKRRRGWTWEDDDDEEDGNGEAVCESCKWHREASRFCNMLRTGRYD